LIFQKGTMMRRKVTHLVAFVLAFVLFSSICWGLENYKTLQEEAVFVPNIAHNPEPYDGAIHENTLVILSWSPGRYAASHNVYFGDSFYDVNNGTLDTFMGNHRYATFYFPETIWPNSGTTYYWRVDEVNDLHPSSPWKGNVWSFWIPPEIAYEPNPPDSAKFIDPNVTLRWTAGLHAQAHTVYFGNSFDDVNNASGGLSQESTSYNPGTLEFEKTYYWRVDEFDNYTTKKGDVWSFTTKPFDPNLAYYPNPPDGAKHEDVWVVLSWEPGAFAASHDVYIGENFNDVFNGTNDTFEGNQSSTFIVLGFPRFAFPRSFIPGTTYYWRVDEVNDLHPDSPWKVNIWSFWITPKTAHEPNPPDGAGFVKPNVTLSWTAGFGAKLHTIYFGDSLKDVNNASGGQYQHATTYNPGLLEFDKTYYWRVDEYDAFGTYKGEVWSFRTKPYDPNIAYNPQPPDGTIHPDLWANLQWWPGLHAASHDVYIGKNFDDVNNATDDTFWTFWGNKHDLWIVIGFPDFVGHSMGLMVPREKIYWRIDEVNDLHPDSPWKGDIWSFRITPTTAYAPNPPDGAEFVVTNITLSWKAGLNAKLHTVYLGDNFDEVNNASEGISQESTIYNRGSLKSFETYYWRVDEFDGKVTHKGDVWNFTTRF
jgi:hypothetical protein